MTVEAGPDVITNGLVFYADAANSKSYSSNRFISYGTGKTTENVTFSIQGNGTFQRVAAGTVIGGYTVLSNDVVYSYVLGSNGCHYHGNSFPIPSEVSATFSFDYLVTGATNYPLTNYLANFENYGGGGLAGAVLAPNTLQDVWQRVSFTSGPTTSAGTQAAFLYPGGCSNSGLASSGTIYFRNPKVELKSSDSGSSVFSSMSNLITTTDLTGNGINGTLTNGPVYSSVNGGTILFDGADDFIDCGNSSILNVENIITVNSWFYVGSTSAYQPIASKVVSDFSLGWEMSNSNGVFRTTLRPSATQINLSAGGLSLNTWYMGTMTFDGITLKLYLNGVEQGSTTTGGPVTLNSTEPLRIGSRVQGNFYNGRISNVAIYNRALLASEILKSFNAQRGRYGI